MKHLLALALLCATTLAQAQTGVVEWWLDNDPAKTFDSQAKCDAAAKALNVAKAYQCPRVLRVTAKPAACPAKPANETRPGQCPTGTSGAWTQVRTYNTSPAPACWTTGPWGPASAPAGVCVTLPPSTEVWTKIADENASFTVAANQTVRYGFGAIWTQRAVSGIGSCSNTFFGTDPSPGIEKQCELRTSGTTPPTTNPFPNGETRSVQCVAPAAGSWQQARTYTLVGTTWTAGAWIPNAAQAGECVISTDPPPSGPLSATRTSGPAPLAVLVDASAMGAFNGTYTFNFGDERGQRWAVSGLPKNTQTGGALAAHVYDLPGTYTVTVGTARLTITVTDPNAAYAGTATICVSTSSNWAGCPTGAAQQTSLPSAYAGKRVLLRRGESFGGISPQNTDSGFQVGAYGTGAKPVVAGVSTGMRNGVASWTGDWTVMDLDVGSVNIDATTTRFLLYRNDIKRPSADAMVNIGTAAGYYQQNGGVGSTIPWPREVFLVENDILGAVQSGSRPNLVVMGYFRKSALLGNTMDRATEHTLRIWAASKTVIAHNSIGGNHYAPNPPGIRGALKMHSGGAQPFTDLVGGSSSPATSQVVIANNVIGSATYPGSFLSGMGPQNADPGTVEGLEDCIAENNVFVHGPYTSSDMQLRGRRLTARGNTVQGGGKPDIVRSGGNFDPGMAVWDGPYFLQ